MKSSAAGCGLLAVALLLGGCYTVPETGRKSLILPLVNDAAQGAAAFADMKAKQEISKDAEKNARVQRVGKRIAAAVGDALPGASLVAQLDEQREAIASEKLALMAAIEFPRLAPAERAPEELDDQEEAEIVVVEDTEFGRKLGRILMWLLGIIVLGTLVAFALPALATL